MTFRPLALAAMMLAASCAPQRVDVEAEQNLAITEMRSAKTDASLSNSAARFNDSEALLRNAVDLCAQIFSPTDADCADLRARLALELVNIRKPTETQTLLQTAREASVEATGTLDPPRVKTLEALVLGRQGRFTEAYDLALQAGYERRDALVDLSRRAAVGGEGDRQLYIQGISDGAHGFLVAAGMAYRLGDYPKARAAGLVARNLMLTLRERPAAWLSFIDSLVASADAKLGEVELAEQRQRLAVRSRRLAVGETVATALAELRLSDVQITAEKTEEAYQTGLKALEFLRSESRRADFRGVDADDIAGFLRAAHRSADDDPFNRAERYEAMFEAAQLVYAGAAAETLRKLAARLAAEQPEIAALAEELESARIERDRLRLTLSRSLSSALTDRDLFENLRDRAIIAANRLQEAEEALNTAFPEYAELSSASAITADDISDFLGRGEALVTFSIGPDDGFAFLVKSGRVVASPIEIGATAVDAVVRDLRRAFDVTALGIAPFDMAGAHKLYNALFGPLQSELIGVDHLVIAPVGALLSFPFAALVDQAPTGLSQEDYVRASWFGAERSISYTPSVKAFANLRRFARPSTATRNFIGFGDPTFTGQGGGLAALGEHCQTDGPTPPELIRGLAPLPGTRDEVESVSRSLGGATTSLFIGGQATEDAVRNASLDDYRIIYFATHGLLPGELRCQAEPGLALTAPVFAPSRAEDGLLSASEVAQLRLDADLVVLSACNTGGGGEGQLGGEALSGLASSFFLAGARSLIVSHWQVDSQATTDLMSDAFARFERVGGAAEALRLAQSDLAREPERSHPFFWAAFTVIGDGVPPARSNVNRL